MLLINNPLFIERSEILWEKGTNRAAFFRGEINKYEWVDIGSSFLPSDIIAAFLYAQLENLDNIQKVRCSIWKEYYKLLLPLMQKNKLKLPFIPDYATNNAHMFYIECNSNEERNSLIDFLKKYGINSVFHYLPLHRSSYFKNRFEGEELYNTLEISKKILRLPFFYELTLEQVNFICEKIIEFYEG